MNFTREELFCVLKDKIDVDSLDLSDLSKSHHNHTKHNPTGGGHYRLTIVSRDFEGKSLLERHRMVYQILELDSLSSVHALSLKALTPEENQA